MNESLAVNILYSAEDYARSAKYIRQRNFLAKYAFLGPLVIFTIILAFFLLQDPSKFISAFSRPDNLIVLLVIPIFTPVLYFLSRRKYSLLVRRKFQKLIESSPALQQSQLIVFDDEGIEGKTLLGSGTTLWQAIIEATETKEDFYFFTGKTFAIFVPKRAFENERQVNELRKMAVEYLGSRSDGLHLHR